MKMKRRRKGTIIPSQKGVETKVIEKFVRNDSVRKTKLCVPEKLGTMSNNTSQSSSRRGTLSTNVSMETNLGESKNIDKMIDSNATRRSSEPVSATSSTKSVEPNPLRDSKTLSNSFAFQNADKNFVEHRLSNNRDESSGRFFEDKNPVKRIPTQV